MGTQPSGKTLEEAWEDADPVSLSKGSALIAMARRGDASHIGFDAVTDSQGVACDVLLRSGFHAEGVWGFLKPYQNASGYDNGLSYVAQFQHDSFNSLRIWLRNKHGQRGKPYCAAERIVPVVEVAEEWVSATESEFRLGFED